MGGFRRDEGLGRRRMGFTECGPRGAFDPAKIIEHPVARGSSVESGFRLAYQSDVEYIFCVSSIHATLWGEHMFRILIPVAVATFSISTTITQAETGPCQETKLKQKVACLNKRLGEFEKLVQTLPTKKDLDNSVGSSAATATSAIVEKLKNVRIEWAERPGVCLFFNDWTTKPERTAYTVEGCSTPQPGFHLSVVLK
jgi:hypothetical protein